jgi:hypothetical protein
VFIRTLSLIMSLLVSHVVLVWPATLSFTPTSVARLFSAFVAHLESYSTRNHRLHSLRVSKDKSRLKFAHSLTAPPSCTNSSHASETLGPWHHARYQQTLRFLALSLSPRTTHSFNSTRQALTQLRLTPTHSLFRASTWSPISIPLIKLFGIL